MAAPEGFSYELRKDGTVAIRHHGRFVTTLRGAKASRFVVALGAAGGHTADGQQLMARMTGNYRRGNERGRQRDAEDR
jgi:hypothetical protein